MIMTGGARVLDRARGQLFGVIGRWPAAQALARRRGLRLALVALASLGLAFAGAALLPLLLLAVAPLVLGVPHVAADVRYLVVRRDALPRRAWAPLAVAAAVCTLGSALGDLQLMAAGGWSGVALAALFAVGACWRRAIIAAFAVTAGALAWRWPTAATLVMAQGHNFIAVALALWLARRRLRVWWLPALAFGVAVTAIAVGVLDVPLGAALASGSGVRLTATTIVPAGATSTLALRLIGVFSFTQAVHYAFWLRLVPDAERAGERPIGYRHSLALLRRDFGRATPLVILLALALPLSACLNAVAARNAYFTLAAFHGYLELAFVAAYRPAAS